jgi:hypothetical protein
VLLYQLNCVYLLITNKHCIMRKTIKYIVTFIAIILTNIALSSYISDKNQETASSVIRVASKDGMLIYRYQNTLIVTYNGTVSISQ